MSDIDLHDLAAPYALSALEGDELERFEAHLVGCDDCRRAVATLQEGAAALAMASAEAPPARLKGSVLDALGHQTEPATGRPGFFARWSRWIAAGAATAVVAIAIVVGAVLLADGEDPFDRVASAPNAIVAELEATPDLATEPTLAQVAFSPEDGRVAIEIEGLPAAPSGQTYEAWIIDDGGPIPAGLFDSRGQRAVFQLDGTASSGMLVAVTLEPAGGVDAPTGAPLFVAELPSA